MAGGTKRRGMIAEINVTPLVDVVLVLLVVFMVTAELLNSTTAIPIKLPKAATSEKVQPTKPLRMTVTAKGSYLLDGKKISVEALVLKVRERRKLTGDKTEVIVSADKSSRHELFVRLLDILRAEGISRFAIQTQDLAEDSGV
jgi:biopolymer transport protein ExbD